MRAFILNSAFATSIIILLPTASLADEVGELRARVAVLEERLASLEVSLKPLVAKARIEQLRSSQQLLARKRMGLDRTKYSREELKEIETLYQVANKNWGTQRAQDSLRKLVEKYDEANRTGCAILYLGQMSNSTEQIEYLEKAVEQYGDCFYGDGVQVGAYARLVLGKAYSAAGKSEKAKAMFDELRKSFPDAIDHKGNSLLELLSE